MKRTQEIRIPASHPEYGIDADRGSDFAFRSRKVDGPGIAVTIIF